MISDEYAAGFFDGEGTVYAAIRNNSGRPSPTIMVTITNTVREPLDRLHAKWGGSIFLDRSKKPNQQDKYQWTVAAKKARPFLEAMLPHLIIKREVAETAIEMCALMALPHKERVDYSNTVFRHGRLWSSPVVRPEFKAKIEQLHTRIRDLNSRRCPKNARRSYITSSDPRSADGLGVDGAYARRGNK